MSVNNVQISARTLPFQNMITANGSYTIPQYAFIPHPSLQQLAGPMVNSPTFDSDPGATFAATPYQQIFYPTPDLPAVYGVRSLQIKSSP